MKTKLICAAVTIGALFTQPVWAGDAYVIDANHTVATFSIERAGFNKVIGAFSDVKGTLELDENNPENSSARVEIATNSVWSGYAERDGHLKSEYWLNVEKYPTITFVSTSVVLNGENKARVTGDLTIWGQTHPAVLNVTLNKIGMDSAAKKRAAGFSMQTRIKRSDYGHTLAIPVIGDEVEIKIEVLSHRKE